MAQRHHNEDVEVVDLLDDSLSPDVEELTSAEDTHANTAPLTTIDLCASSSQAVEALPGKQTDSSESGGAAGTTPECPICLQTCIHPARLPCGHIFCFLCVKGVAYKNRRCAMCRREIPPEFLDHPQLVNGIEDITTTKATEDGYQWFYEGRNGGWWAYDQRSSEEIEEAYQQFITADVVDLDDGCTHDILICGTLYTIHFGQMVQYQQNMTKRRRWWQYDDRTSQDIEDGYKRGEKSCTILVAGYVYIVDLETMIQQRQNEPTRCRRVKRDLATIPKKGVAGLRIEGNTVTTDSNFALQVYQQQRPYPDDPNPSHETRFHNLPPAPTDTDGQHAEFISTMAATDAAIRIASDIIGSTLAHADELSRGVASADAPSLSGENRLHFNVGPTTSSSLRAADEALHPVCPEVARQTIDMLDRTINDFHVLSLLDSSDEDDDEGGDGYTHTQLRF